jgi:Ca2+/Na+ antiporter
MYAYYGFRLNNSLDKDLETVERIHDKFAKPFKAFKYSIGVLELVSALFMLWAIGRLYLSIRSQIEVRGLFD